MVMMIGDGDGDDDGDNGDNGDDDDDGVDDDDDNNNDSDLTSLKVLPSSFRDSILEKTRTK